MGMGITYAAYMRKREDTTLNAFLTGLGNNSIELISGVAVIGTLFALSLSTTEAQAAIQEGGSGLTFIHLSNLFVRMPGGLVIAVMFFMAMAFAALTSMISGVEIITKNFVDIGWPRKKALTLVLFAIFIFGVPSAWSISFLDNQDYVWGTGLILSGFFVSMAVLKFGTTRFRCTLVNTKDSDVFIGRWWDVILKVVVPSLTVVFIVWFLFDKYMRDPGNAWNPFHEQSVATLLVQWIGIFILLWLVNNKVADMFKIRRELGDEKYLPIDIDEPFYFKDGGGIALRLIRRAALKIKTWLRRLLLGR
jgi:NSS family neurotransmitter:Na+ symporter